MIGGRIIFTAIHELYARELAFFELRSIRGVIGAFIFADNRDRSNRFYFVYHLARLYPVARYRESFGRVKEANESLGSLSVIKMQIERFFLAYRRTCRICRGHVRP